jgi:hypothetical protein
MTTVLRTVMVRSARYRCRGESTRQVKSLPHEKCLEEHGPHAYNAIVAELKQLMQEKKTMRPVVRGDVTLTALKKVIRTFMFLKTKFDGMGRFEKSKLDW